MTKRKLFLGNKPVGGSKVVKSLKRAREVTGLYHELRNKIELLRRTSGNAAATMQEIKALENQVQVMGGTAVYQEASVVATRHHKTSRWVLQQIDRHRPPPSLGNKIDVLEVGAINTQLQAASHLRVRAIDVRATCPKIEELDFFDLAVDSAWDCVVCSMVMNCVTDSIARGEMLVRLCLGHLRRDEHALLLFSLPTRCLASAHVGKEDFARLLGALGVTILEIRDTPKITFYSLRPAAPEPSFQALGHQRRCRDLLRALPKSERACLEKKFRSKPLGGEVVVCRTSADFSLILSEDYWK